METDKKEKENVLHCCEATGMFSTQEKISLVCSAIEKVLLTKNKNYGNSALEPLRVFSNSSPEEAILVRLDDKLSRIKNSSELRKNDCFDTLGYLVLLCVQKGWIDFEELID